MSGEQIKPGYKRTEVGVIPEEWEVKALGDCLLGRPRYGINAPAVPFSDRLPAYIRITDITEDGRFGAAHPVSVDSALAGNYYLNDGDLVFARTGASVGKSYRYVPDDGPLVFAGFLIQARPNPEVLSPAYAAAYVTTGAYWNWVRLMSMRSGQPGINGNEFAKLPVPIPSVAEQHAIADALSDVDALLAKLDQLIAKKRDLKQATMQQLLTGQTRLPGFSGAWEVKRLGDVAFANWGNVEITKDYYCESGFTAYSASGADGLVSWYEHEGEGIVLSAIGAQCGKSWLATGKWTPIKNTIWIKGLPDKLNSSFLYWISQSPDFWPTRGQAQPFIALGDVRNVFLSCPSLSEQIVIATVMSDMDAELAVLEARRDKTRALKQGMMQELLTGRIRLV